MTSKKPKAIVLRINVTNTATILSPDLMIYKYNTLASVTLVSTIPHAVYTCMLTFPSHNYVQEIHVADKLLAEQLTNYLYRIRYSKELDELSIPQLRNTSKHPEIFLDLLVNIMIPS